MYIYMFFHFTQNFIVHWSAFMALSETSDEMKHCLKNRSVVPNHFDRATLLYAKMYS